MAAILMSLKAECRKIGWIEVLCGDFVTIPGEYQLMMDSDVEAEPR